MYTGDKECVHIYQTEDNTTLYKVAALITWYGLDEFPDSCYDATLGISSTKDISEPIGTVREALHYMITDTEAIFLAERCFGYREVADLLKSQKSIVFKCNAAFQLAMCAEYMYEFEASTR